MLITLLFTLIILVICVLLLNVKILFKKGGRFPNLHIDGNKALRKKGIFCARTMDRLAAQKQNLYDRLEKIEEE